MSNGSFGIHGKQVVTPQGVKDAVVLVENGTIFGVVDRHDVPPGTMLIEAGDSVVMAGLVDSHVHVNEPGRTEWEGFDTATRAAAAGGITTIADMPLNSNPVTTTLDAFTIKQKSTAGKLHVDCAFFGGVVPGNTASLLPLIEAGVVGFKCFLIHSGIDDFPNVSESDLSSAMPVLARHAVPLLVHAELEREHHNHAWDDARSYKSFLESRPRKWEDDAISLMIKLSHKYDCKVHIVHLSSADTIGEIQKAAKQGLFTVETCPHYLTFAAEEIPDGDPRFKCAPPIRERENREKLWAALKDGVIKMVVSDHSPCVPDLKFLPEGDLKKAWGGVASLQFRLPAVWTEARKRGMTLEDVSRWLCSAPAEFLGLGDRKGKLAPGFDADIVIWDQNTPTVFQGDNIHHKHKVTPYEGRQLQGVVKQTFLRGQKIYENGKLIKPTVGEAVLRRSASVAT
jgi:allantoinase